MLNFMDSLVLITSRLKKKKKTKGYPSNLGGQILQTLGGRPMFYHLLLLVTFRAN
jgi:hypothetical protein